MLDGSATDMRLDVCRGDWFRRQLYCGRLVDRTSMKCGTWSFRLVALASLAGLQEAPPCDVASRACPERPYRHSQEQIARDLVPSRGVGVQNSWADQTAMSGCDERQADTEIMAQRCDGFQAHVAGSLNCPLIVLFK